MVYARYIVAIKKTFYIACFSETMILSTSVKWVYDDINKHAKMYCCWLFHDLKWIVHISYFGFIIAYFITFALL